MIEVTMSAEGEAVVDDAGSNEANPGAIGAESSALRTVRDGLRAAPALRQGLGLTVFFALVGATGRVAIPVLVQQTIDSGINSDAATPNRSEVLDVGRISVLCAIAIVWLLIAGISQRTAVWRLGRRSETALLDLRTRLFGRIHRIGIEDHNDEKRGALVARVTSDVETLSQFFSWGALSFLLSGALMAIVAIVMLAYNWLLALVVFVVAAPLVVVLRQVQVRLVAAYERTRAANAELLATTAELVTGAETIRAYDAGGEFARRAKLAAERKANDQVRASFMGSLLFPSGEVFGVFAISAIIAIGWQIGPSSGLSPGALIGFVFLTYRFLEPVAELSEVIDQTQTAVAGLRRVLGVLAIPETPPPTSDPIPLPTGPLDIFFDRVCFSYRPRRGEDESSGPAVDDVDLRIPHGTSVAVVGSTGSGKTTLGRLLARFIDPSEGQINLSGIPLSRVSNDEFRKRLVVVPQEPFLFEGTIADNVRFGKPNATEAEITQAFVDLDLETWLLGLDAGVATQVGARGSRLSAGERQLVALVRAAIVDPDILVLDEATSSVDAVTEVGLQRALDRLATGRTIVAIAHRLSTAERADRVLVMKDARVIQDSSHAELVSQVGEYRDLYDAWRRSTDSNAGQ
ncbi:MAG: ABC transporter ATP-binding protein [Actinomycetota bacterium]